jgi:thiol:disulfide interchange protein
MSRIGFSLVLCLLLPVVALSQEERMKLTASVSPQEAGVGESVTLKLLLDISAGFHTYPTSQTDPNASAFTTVLRVKEGPLVSAGPAKEPKPKEKFDQDLKATVGIYEEPTEIEIPYKVKAGTPPGKVKVVIKVQTQVCNEMNCQPFNEDVSFELTVTDKKVADPAVPNKAGAAPPAPQVDKGNNKGLLPIGEKIAAAKTGKNVEAENQNNSLSGFLGQAVFWGFLSLLTPCVFPMIPITVSYFLKQKEQGFNSLAHATVYTVTIVVAMTIFTLFFVGAAQKLIYHWGTNFFIGALLIFFALSLLGMFDIVLPSFLSRMTSSGEAKGGYLGTLFMALTFIIISFSCVAPFVGGFAGVSAQERPFLWNLLGAFTFALCFASPFFLLAMFPSMLKKLPKSGGWMNSLKVVMGILEIAAGLKFLRQAELNYRGNNPDLFSYDVVMASYIALCFFACLYLLRVYRLPHDHDDDSKPVGVGRFLWAFVFLTLGVYLFPSLFRGPDGYKLRPSGEVFNWIDSFLLQGDDTRPIKLSFNTGGGGQTSHAEKWYGFLPEALAEAKAKKRRIFIDFTGINCTNCTKNERAIFSQDDVKAAFADYTLCKLYTDTVPLEYYPTDRLDTATVDVQEKHGEEHRLMEKQRFDTTELPFYVIVEPVGDDFKEIARYSVGLIRDKNEFLQFLKKNTGK